MTKKGYVASEGCTTDDELAKNTPQCPYIGVYECLDIVRGIEQNPTPVADANGILPEINAALRIRIDDWNRRHTLAREALLRCFRTSGDYLGRGGFLTTII